MTTSQGDQTIPGNQPKGQQMSLENAHKLTRQVIIQSLHAQLSETLQQQRLIQRNIDKLLDTLVELGREE